MTQEQNQPTPEIIPPKIKRVLESGVEEVLDAEKVYKMSPRQLRALRARIDDAVEAIKNDLNTIGGTPDRYRLAIQSGISSEPVYAGEIELIINGRKYKILGHGPGEREATFTTDPAPSQNKGWIEFIPLEEPK